MAYTPGQPLGGLRTDLGSLQLGAVDSAGVAWRLQSLEGWDSSEIRAEMQQREADHGAWPAPAYLAERPITIGGLIEAPDRTALDDAMERMRAAVALTDTVLTVWESVPKRAVVRRSGRLVMQYQSDRTATYSALVTAPDPRRYGIDLNSQQTALASSSGGLVLPMTLPVAVAATTASGSVTTLNAGKFPTRPRFIIDGPVSAPRIITVYEDGTTLELAYSEDLNTGDQVVIDTDAHTVILNGNAGRRRFLSGPWPEITPGMVTVQFKASAYSATARLTVEWRSAWI